MSNKARVFTGAATAVVTPFKNGVIDYDVYGNILEYQIKNGINGIVVCGTTGEAATLSDDEHRDIIEYTVKKVSKRVPVIAGTGSNDTAYAIELSKHACDVGADAILSVTPYYNKASQKGLVKHFNLIADSVDKPVLLYNVPARTNLNISIESYKELAKHPNIVGVKEASDSITFISDLLEACVGELDIYSGNDDRIVPMMSIGAVGVISVLSNVMPAEISELTRLYLEGDVKKAAELQLKYLKLMNAMFMTVNPIPIKTAMAKMGFCRSDMRLPLCEMDESDNEKLYNVMRNYNLIK
ncbi:MAG: 4-hydroxy-tetrahydrodipicolinate synthase [Eubacteriales bacterium]|nr:4-hydroxy-tetrahydrodipicolinate synthase [Eubacteriales bacterium]MDD4422564.1 4-hydroxy-tetrahydrodipicolinate synthase [Eubacteriales bacterium]HBR31473.1 4-hydroxy-tetrahydrodipicolinate synthase [Clostridiales bacterium]